LGLDRLEQRIDQQSRAESKTRLVEQIGTCVRSADYSRALDLLRATAAEFPNDAELSELEKAAQDGVKRKADADRLITESQELFAQRKSAEAIQLLRKAYELDKRNSLARAILANALVEHAHSIVETDWLEAETLANQALALNPSHPTAKTIRSLVVDRKKTSSVDDWVANARKRQSSGDLFAALAWVAEGLAVHPDDSKLLQIQDAIQRDQAAQRRQARRGDVEELRRMAGKIDATAAAAAKQALAERIQGIAAKYWTDGEILAIANSLLLRLGLVPQEGSTASSPRKKGSAVIFHVPRPSAPEPAGANISLVLQNAEAPSSVSPVSVPASGVPPSPVLPSIAPTDEVPPSEAPPVKAPAVPPEPQSPAPPAAVIPAAQPSSKITPPSSKPKQASRSNSSALIFVSVAAIIVVAATMFFARKHPAPPVATTTAAAPTVSAPVVSAPAVSPPAVSAPVASAPAQTSPEPSLPASPPSSDTAAGKVTPPDQPSPSLNFGTLLVVAGQDNASVFLNGKLQRQVTQAGQLRLPNLELKDYDVQVSKSGFQDPPHQKIRIRSGEQALIFSLQPQPSLASLTIQGAAPGTTVLVDQTPVGTVQPDGALSVSTVTPGDHTVELRKERFKPRQFKKHFVVGGTISLAAADAALEPAPGELKITFAPADAKVGIVNGDRLTIVSSGVPLNLAPGTYTLTARTADGFTRSSTFEVIAGQSKTLDLSLVPNGMSKWDDPGAWRHDGDSYVRKGGDFVLYGVVPASGTFVFSAMPAKGRLLQWVINYTDSKNYVLFQMDENNFYRTVIRNGQKTDQIIVPDKGDKKSFRALHIRVSPNEIVHQIKHGYSWTVLDRWTQPGADLSSGKFGFYIPGNDEVALSNFAQYVDLNTR
jgi:tetratricopeptide (TPR) repeat protein